MTKGLLLIISCYLLLSVSCLNDKADEIAGPCDSTHFVNAIKPIFIASCYDPQQNGSCHNEPAAAVRGNFSVYSASMNGIEAHLSEIKYRINLPLNHIDHMPQGGTLSPQDLSVLNAWLDEGGKLCQ